MIEQLQRSVDWHESRCGRITGSRVKDVLAVSKRDGKPLQAREDYLTELVIERLTGVAIGVPTTPAMQWGKDVESAAIAAYEARTGLVVQSVGFGPHPTLACFGASPDGLIGTDGGIEAKCPFNSRIHLETLRHGMPLEHMPQVQSGMSVFDRKWWDFISFDPRFPGHLRLYVQRIYRDQPFIDSMIDAVQKLDVEVNEALTELMNFRKAA